ncbi:MAG: alpha/beta hydrolase [Variovorax sp.]
MFDLHPDDGAGQMAAIEFGPTDRPVDIVFLHANGFNGMTYRQILEPLGTGLRILALDQRGHGRSTLPTDLEGHAWSRYADDLAALLAALPDRPRLLAGHSMGGAAILLASLQMAAGRAPAMVLFDPVLRLPEDVPDAAAMAESPLTRGAKRRNAVFASRQAALESYRGRGAFKTWPDAMVEDYLSDGLRPLDDGRFTLSCTPAWEAANFMSSYQTSALPALRHPAATVHILRAEHETTCAIGADAQAWGGQPQVRVETVSGTTHFLPMERPELVRSALLGALSATDVASGRR